MNFLIGRILLCFFAFSYYLSSHCQGYFLKKYCGCEIKQLWTTDPGKIVRFTLCQSMWLLQKEILCMIVP